MVDTNPGDVTFNPGQMENLESALFIALAELNDCRIKSAVVEIKAAIGILQGGKIADGCA